MMKIKFVFPLLVALLVTSTSVSADYTWFSTSTNSWRNSGQPEFLEGKVPLALLDSLDKIYKKSPYNYVIYELDERLFVQVRCTFDLYEIQEGKLVNKYIYSNRG